MCEIDRPFPNAYWIETVTIGLPGHGQFDTFLDSSSLNSIAIHAAHARQNIWAFKFII